MEEVFSDFRQAARAAAVRAKMTQRPIFWQRQTDGTWYVPAVVCQGATPLHESRQLNEDEARAVWGAEDSRAFAGVTTRVFYNGVLMSPDELANMDWRG